MMKQKGIGTLEGMAGLLVLAVAVLMVVPMINGCQLDNIKPISEMTPQEKATFFVSLYNSQDKNYREMATLPNLTDAQKEMLRMKKNVMLEVYPLIKSYSSYIENGAVPSEELEQQITSQLDRISTMIIQY